MYKVLLNSLLTLPYLLILKNANLQETVPNTHVFLCWPKSEYC